MSGGRKLANRAFGRPLDGVVRPHSPGPDHRLAALGRESMNALLGGYRRAAGQLVFDAADAASEPL